MVHRLAASVGQREEMPGEAGRKHIAEGHRVLGRLPPGLCVSVEAYSIGERVLPNDQKCTELAVGIQWVFEKLPRLMDMGRCTGRTAVLVLKFAL